MHRGPGPARGEGALGRQLPWPAPRPARLHRPLLTDTTFLGTRAPGPTLQMRKLRLKKVWSNCLQVLRLGMAEPGSVRSAIPPAWHAAVSELCLRAPQPLAWTWPCSFTSPPSLGPCGADPSLLAAPRTLLAVLDPAETTQVTGTYLHMCPPYPPPPRSSQAWPSRWLWDDRMDSSESPVLAPLARLQRCGSPCWRPGPSPGLLPHSRLCGRPRRGGPPDWLSRSGLIGYPLLPARRLLLDISLDG